MTSRRPSPRRRRNHVPDRLEIAVPVRVLLLAVIIFVAVAAVTLLYLINLSSENQRIAQRTADLQKTGRASRLAAQAETEIKIRQLACFLDSFIPSDTVHGRDIKRLIETRYDCATVPALSAPALGKPTPKPSGPSAAPSSLQQALGTPPAAPASSASRITRSPSAAVSVQARRAASPAPVQTHVRTPVQAPSVHRGTSAPAPRTPTPRPSSSASSAALLPIGSVLCSTLDVCLNRSP